MWKDQIVHPRLICAESSLTIYSDFIICGNLLPALPPFDSVCAPLHQIWLPMVSFIVDKESSGGSADGRWCLLFGWKGNSSKKVTLMHLCSLHDFVSHCMSCVYNTQSSVSGIVCSSFSCNVWMILYDPSRVWEGRLHSKEAKQPH